MRIGSCIIMYVQDSDWCVFPLKFLNFLEFLEIYSSQQIVLLKAFGRPRNTQDKGPKILLMEELPHKLIGSLSHYLQGLYIPGGAGFLPSTVSRLHQLGSFQRIDLWNTLMRGHRAHWSPWFLDKNAFYILLPSLSIIKQKKQNMYINM